MPIEPTRGAGNGERFPAWEDRHRYRRRHHRRARYRGRVSRFLPLQRDQRDIVGRIDILTLIAGTQAFKPLMEMRDADWHDQIDVNPTGTATMLRIVAPRMARQGGA